MREKLSLLTSPPVPSSLHSLQQTAEEKTIPGQQDRKAVLWNQGTMA